MKHNHAPHHAGCARSVVAIILACAALVAPALATPIAFQTFDSRTHYSGVLLQQGRVQLDADFNESGDIAQGQALGIFRVQFDPLNVQPLIGSGIVGGLAIGAKPDGTFSADQRITLHVSPGLGVSAAGVVISTGPDPDPLAAGIFRLSVNCLVQPCPIASNSANTPITGGQFFLGIVAPPGDALEELTIAAIAPVDDMGRPAGVVPPWQIAAITFALVPEPATLALLGIGLLGLVMRRSNSTR